MLLHDSDYLLKRISNLYIRNEDRYKRKYLTDENLSKIVTFKNKHNGERCFIIGSSPSLNELDLALLNKEYTFICNHGYRLACKNLYHATYYTITDNNPVICDNIFDEMPSNFSDNIFSYAGINIDQDFKHIIYFDMLRKIGFSDSLDIKLYVYSTVIVAMLQIAYFMGFKEMYLIGVDLDYQNNRGYAYNATDKELQRQNFRSAVGSDGMLKEIAFAANFLQTNKIILCNASPTGRVNCMPRIQYKDLF